MHVVDENKLKDVVSKLPQPLPLDEMLVLAEEFGEQLARKMPKPPTLATYTFPYPRSYVLKAPVDILREAYGKDVAKPGTLKELTAISSVNTFAVTVICDGRQLWDDSWTTLSEISEQVGVITAMQPTDDTYWLGLYNLNWVQSAKVVLRPTAGVSQVTFTHLRATMEVRE